MRCSYCNKEIKLQRWVEHKWDGEEKYLSERFIYECPECCVVFSPRFALIDNTETEQEKKVLRDLFFSVQIKEQEIKNG